VLASIINVYARHIFELGEIGKKCNLYILQ